MKKSLIYTFTAAFALLVSGGITLAIGSASQTEATQQTVLAANTDTGLLPSALTNFGSKDESVYIITNATGAASQTFIGNTLYADGEPLPINLGITYYLDGAEVSASELAGKSGHVKMEYHYTATRAYQRKLVPFIVATGLQLDGTKFSNVKITNGKILSEDGGYTILGYGFAGLGDDLGTDLLPDTFTIEADTTGFELGTAYTFATNEVIADLDTSKLSSVDSVVSSINQLSNGLDQIIAGSTQLDSGISALASGAGELQSGAAALNDGANQLASGANDLSDGASALAGGLADLNTGVSELATNIGSLDSYLDTLADSGTTLNTYISAAIDTIITQVNTAIAGTGYTVTLENYSTVLPAIIASIPDEATKATLTNAKNSLDLYVGMQNYIAGVAAVTAGADQLNANMPTLTTGATRLSNGADALATGAAQLANGADSLLVGTVQLKSGMDAFVSGAGQLSSGSQALNDGLVTFKTTGMDKLVSFANNDLASFTAKLRASVAAARSYHSYGGMNTESVKFVFKTPSIK